MATKQKSLLPTKRFCYLCHHDIRRVDYKNSNLLQRFTSSYFKIVPKRRSGVCSTHQRLVSKAIKRARFMALLPFCPK